MHCQHAVHGGVYGSDTELPCGRYGVVRVFLYPSICCSWYITLFPNIRALVAVQGLWWAENAYYTLDYGLGYCFGRFITDR